MLFFLTDYFLLLRFLLFFCLLLVKFNEPTRSTLFFVQVVMCLLSWIRRNFEVLKSRRQFLHLDVILLSTLPPLPEQFIEFCVILQAVFLSQVLCRATLLLNHFDGNYQTDLSVAWLRTQELKLASKELCDDFRAIQANTDGVVLDAPH